MKNKKAVAGIIGTMIVSNAGVQTIQALTLTAGNHNIYNLEVSTGEESENTNKIVEAKNIRIGSSSEVVNISENIETLKNLEEGTIIVRFRSKKDDIDSLVGISNSTKSGTHFHMYESGGKVGVEIRDESTGTNKHIYTNTALNDGFNTVAFKVEKDKSYSIYLNGELVKEELTNDTKFLKDIVGLNSAFIGKTPRSSGNQYEFTGDMDFVEIYSNTLAAQELINITGETKTAKEDDNLPENAYKSEPQDLFYPGFLGSNNYRIPALYTTKEGTVISSIDARIIHGGDSPNNIDTAIRRSEDGGKTWDEGKIILNYPENASAIDSALLQDEETGRIFNLITHFPSGYGYPNAKVGSGYKEIDGARYLQLFDSSNNEYTVREEGKVYDSQGNVTSYTVNEDKEVFQNGERISNVLTSTSPLKVMGTSFLSLIYSDDDGKTWSKPIDLNIQVKEDWMKFLGTAPGRGHQIQNGEYAGRLVFPIYLNNKYGFQSSGIIYSDDNGQTWEIGETATDGRDMGNGQIGNAQTQQSGNQLTECQVVEMPNGQLKMFMRNTGTYVRIATSFDGGATWDNNVAEDINLREPYCQLSVINYSQQVDGKDALLFSNPNSGSRSNGTVRIGLINEDGTHENGQPKYEFEWKYNKVVEPGYYAYSCLTELPNNNIGLFYEGTSNQKMSYTEMNLDYIQYKMEEQISAPKLESVTVLEQKEYYNADDEIKLKLEFDQSISIIGNRNITIDVNGTDMVLEMSEYESPQEVIFVGKIPKNIQVGDYPVAIKANEDMDIINLFNKVSTLEQFNTSITLKIGEPKIQSPVNVSLENRSDNATKISWGKPESTTRLVEYVVYQNGEKIGTVNKDKELIFTATNLSPETTYLFEVTSKYENGQESDPVSLEAQTTEVLNKLYSPRKINAAISGTSALISWDVAQDSRGIESYVIYVDGKEVDTIDVSENNYTLDSLQGKTKYKVEVSSRYLGGKESKTVKINVNIK